jgi:signal transduction histidine kinase
VPDWFVPQLFEAFTRAGRDDPSLRTGLGLGLAIARDLAIANAGLLRYDPSGPGARFELLLPTGVPAEPERRSVGDRPVTRVGRDGKS